MDTTVILAQPRVSRLRAAVIYVNSVGLSRAASGCVGHPRKSIESIRENFPGPPFFWSTDRGIWRKKKGIGRRDLAAKIQVFHCPK